MNVIARTAVFATLFAAACTAAWAQSPPAVDPGAPPPPRVRTVNGIDYVNGGAGEESRAGMDAQRAAFSLRVVFSVLGGAFAVADRLDVQRGDSTLMGVDDAGPILLVKLPPGDYRLVATYQGKTQTRPVRVGSAITTLDWRLDDVAKRP